MNPSFKFLDARGLPCPQPVILLRKTLAEGGCDRVEIAVDDAASRENVLKFAAYAKWAVEGEATEGGVTRIRLASVGSGPAPAAAPVAVPAVPAAAGARVVLITSDGLGQGDPELGRLLMRGFLYTLTEADTVPERIIFMNGGVKLTVEGSACLDNLRKLEARGVEVLACGTCLEFYGLTEALGVGGITNMYVIAGHLLEGATVSLG